MKSATEWMDHITRHKRAVDEQLIAEIQSDMLEYVREHSDDVDFILWSLTKSIREGAPRI